MSILIVGLGFAGRRMLQVLNFARRSSPGRYARPVLVDPNPEVIFPEGYKTFRSLEAALASGSFNSAIVAVNEVDHYDVLLKLAAADIKKIIAEKPLTATLAEAYDVQKVLQGRQFSMNLVERYSPIFEDFFAWRDSRPALRLARAQLYWGKDRLRDLRPTIGVLSEAIHPLDLADFAFGTGQFEVLGGFLNHSDFSSQVHESVADTLHCKLRSDNGAVISLHASFGWIERRREMIANLVGDCKSYLVHFNFDNPYWDCDSLTIYEIDATNGKRRQLLHRAYTNTDFAQELCQLNKVHRFVTTSLNLTDRGVQPRTIVDLNHAVRLQEWLEQIGEALNRTGELLHEELFASVKA